MRRLTQYVLDGDLRPTYELGKGFYNNHIYLNRKAIEDAKLELTVIQEKAAEFLREFSGVQFVATENVLRTGNWNEKTSKYLHGTHLSSRGDLIIELQPDGPSTTTIRKRK